MINRRVLKRLEFGLEKPVVDYHFTSFDLKLALLQYFRFVHQYICVDEFRGADVIVDTGKEIIEIEVKIAKGDLVNGEKAKFLKHSSYAEGRQYHRNHPNKYYFCVPESLVPNVLHWIQEHNDKYGVIAFDGERLQRCIQENKIHWPNNNYFLRIVKTARKLHEEYDDKLRYRIGKRVTSRIANLMLDQFKGRLNESIH